VLAGTVLPATDRIHGRPSAPRSHFWYRADPLVATTKFRDPTVPADGERSMLVELRSTGCQTVLPPSQHPDGEQYAWECEGQPGQIDGQELLRRLRVLAGMALLVRHWPSPGVRQDTALALAGGLLRSGWRAERVDRFIRVVAEAA